MLPYPQQQQCQQCQQLCLIKMRSQLEPQGQRQGQRKQLMGKSIAPTLSSTLLEWSHGIVSVPLQQIHIQPAHYFLRSE